MEVSTSGKFFWQVGILFSHHAIIEVNLFGIFYGDFLLFECALDYIALWVDKARVDIETPIIRLCDNAKVVQNLAID